MSSCALLGTVTVKNLWFGELFGSKGWPGEPGLALSAAAGLHKPKTIEKPVVFGAFGLKMLKNHWFLKPPG